MTDKLEELLRIREQIVKLLAHGELSQDMRHATQQALEGVDRDIAELKAKRID